MSWIVILTLYFVSFTAHAVDKDFNNLALNVHNRYRKLHQAHNLKLDKGLCLMAQKEVEKAKKKAGKA